MLGADNTIRSSLEVKDVLGQIDSGELSRMVQNKCGAEHLRVDASSKDKGKTICVERFWR